MQKLLLSAPALLLAGCAATHEGGRTNPPDATAPPVEYRSAFEGYRPFADPAPADWRKANDAVREAGGHQHGGHK